MKEKSLSPSSKDPLGNPPLSWEILASASHSLDALIESHGLEKSLHKKLLQKSLLEKRYDIAKRLLKISYPPNNQDVFLYASRNLPTEAVALLWDNAYTQNAKQKALCVYLASPFFEEKMFDQIIASLLGKKNLNLKYLSEALNMATFKTPIITEKVLNLDPRYLYPRLLASAAKNGDEDVFAFALKKTNLSETDIYLALFSALKRNMVHWAKKIYEKTPEEHFKKMMTSDLLTQLAKLGHDDAFFFCMDKVKEKEIILSSTRIIATIKEAVIKNNQKMFEHLLVFESKNKSTFNHALLICAEQNNKNLMDLAWFNGCMVEEALKRCITTQSHDTAMYLLDKMSFEQVETTARTIQMGGSMYKARYLEFLQKIRAEKTKDSLEKSLQGIKNGSGKEPATVRKM